MWASAKRIFVDVEGLVHLVRVGRTDRTICDRFIPRFEMRSPFEDPTCVACIAYWTHPCDMACAASNGCDACDGNAPPTMSRS